MGRPAPTARSRVVEDPRDHGKDHQLGGAGESDQSHHEDVVFLQNPLAVNQIEPQSQAAAEQVGHRDLLDRAGLLAARGVVVAVDWESVRAERLTGPIAVGLVVQVEGRKENGGHADHTEQDAHLRVAVELGLVENFQVKQHKQEGNVAEGLVEAAADEDEPHEARERGDGVQNRENKDFDRIFEVWSYPPNRPKCPLLVLKLFWNSIKISFLMIE